MSVTQLEAVGLQVARRDAQHSTRQPQKPQSPSLIDRLGLMLLSAGLLFAVFGFTLRGGSDT